MTLRRTACTDCSEASRRLAPGVSEPHKAKKRRYPISRNSVSLQSRLLSFFCKLPSCLLVYGGTKLPLTTRPDQLSFTCTSNVPFSRLLKRRLSVSPIKQTSPTCYIQMFAACILSQYMHSQYTILLLLHVGFSERKGSDSYVPCRGILYDAQLRHHPNLGIIKDAPTAKYGTQGIWAS